MIERLTGHVPLWLFVLVIVAALAGPGVLGVVEDAGRPPVVVQAPAVLLPVVAPWASPFPSPAPTRFFSCPSNEPRWVCSFNAIDAYIGWGAGASPWPSSTPSGGWSGSWPEGVPSPFPAPSFAP